MIIEHVCYIAKLPKETSSYDFIKEVCDKTENVINDILKSMLFTDKQNITVFVNADDFNKLSLIPIVSVSSPKPLFDIDTMNVPTYKYIRLHFPDFTILYINFCNYYGKMTCNIKEVFK